MLIATANMLLSTIPWAVHSFEVEFDVEDLLLRFDDQAAQLFQSLFVLLQLGSVLHGSVFRELLDLETVILVLQRVEVPVESVDVRGRYLSDLEGVLLLMFNHFY